MYKAGDFLYKLGDKGISKESHRVFIYTGYTDWLNKNHFDHRGLIEKGLAIDATGLNIYC